MLCYKNYTFQNKTDYLKIVSKTINLNDMQMDYTEKITKETLCYLIS